MLDDLRSRCHRSAEMSSLAQTDKALICFDFDEQCRLGRHGVVGVVDRFGQFDFDGNGADIGDAHELKILFLDFFVRQYYPGYAVAEKLSSTNEEISCNTHLRKMPRAIHKVIHRFCGYKSTR